MEEERRARQQANREQVLALRKPLVPDWQPTREQKLWASRIILVLVVLLGILTLIGRIFEITLEEWLKLLAVPITIGAAVPLLNWLQKRRELAIEKQRAQDEALQAYLDQMGQLLLDKKPQLRKSKEDDEIRTLARARTLTVLGLLDATRKTSVLRFLGESTLIQKEEGTNEEHVTSQPIISLSGADLSGADLSGANLIGVNLGGADLSGARLVGAKLSGAHLSGAGLLRANLSGADLSWANVTQDQLDKVKSLEGATMPNGQTYEDWLKGKKSRREDGVKRANWIILYEDWLKDKEGRGEDGENSGTS